MDLSQLPATAFIDPQGRNHTEIDDFLKAGLERILDLLSHATDRPLYSPLSPHGLSTLELPYHPAPDAEILDRLSSLITTCVNPSHPGWMGHMDPMPTTVSLLADLAVAGVNNNMLSVEMSPVFSQLERSMVKTFAQRFGLPDQAEGVMLSGGSLANLQALTVARNVVFGTTERGLVGLERQPVILASEVAHTSIQKAAMVIGLGRSGVIPVLTDSDSRMRCDHLIQTLKHCFDRGEMPFCVVATAGTTTTGNIDPLAEIAQICNEYHLWLHVDAAYGGAIILSQQHRHKLKGIEAADSITFNPQKWLYVAKTCAMILFRDGSLLRSHFQITAPYMDTVEDQINLGEISLQGTRHGDVLKLWLSLQHLGVQTYAHLIDESYRLTTYLRSRLQSYPFIQIASTPEMNLLCFRGVLTESLDRHPDQWNRDLQSYLLHHHHIFFSLPTYRGYRWLRAVLLNPLIDQSTLDRVCEGIEQFVHDSLGSSQ